MAEINPITRYFGSEAALESFMGLSPQALVDGAPVPNSCLRLISDGEPFRFGADMSEVKFLQLDCLYEEDALQQLADVASQLPNVRGIILESMDDDTIDPKPLLEAFPKLEYLSAEYCHFETPVEHQNLRYLETVNDALEGLANTHFPQLEVLKSAWYDDEIISAMVAQQYAHLQHLGFGSTYQAFAPKLDILNTFAPPKSFYSLCFGHLPFLLFHSPELLKQLSWADRVKHLTLTGCCSQEIGDLIRKEHYPHLETLSLRTSQRNRHVGIFLEEMFAEVGLPKGIALDVQHCGISKYHMARFIDSGVLSDVSFLNVDHNCLAGCEDEWSAKLNMPHSIEHQGEELDEDSWY